MTTWYARAEGSGESDWWERWTRWVPLATNFRGAGTSAGAIVARLAESLRRAVDFELTLNTRDVIRRRHLAGNPRDVDADIGRVDRVTPGHREIACDSADLVIAQSPRQQGNKRHVTGGRHPGGVTGSKKATNRVIPLAK